MDSWPSQSPPPSRNKHDMYIYVEMAEMQKAADAANISVLFFSACAYFWAILGHFWAILAILGHFWAILGNFRSFLGHFLLLIFCGKILLSAI